MDYDRLRELQEKFDENPRRYFAPLANEYRKGGQPRRAIEICRAHLAQMPGHMSGQIVYGQALFEAGEWDEARTVFERALTLDPENLIALRSLGDMSLQAGNTAEARTWYTRLLDADPKDVAVIALIEAIDTGPPAPASSAETEIHEAAPATGAPAEAEAPEAARPSEPVATEVEAASTVPAAEAPSEAKTISEIELRTEIEAPSQPEPVTENVSEPIGLERHYPVEAAEPEQPKPAEREEAEAPPSTEPLVSSRQDDANALDSSWEQPSGASVQQPAPADSAPVEPFVNETMAQLYLQQGYSQLALSVYRQLATSRPNDQSLKERIAAIEAADAAAHPDEAPRMRREEPSVERPTEPSGPRSPSVESPTPWSQPGSEESPGFDRSPIDSPPSAPPSRDRESVEYPGREEQRVEPEGIAARQPSIREFFATLGRRRPPRVSGSQPARSGNNTPRDTGESFGPRATSATLDTVFAGATVSQSDARAASRLAGAFSGATGSGARTPPTPAMPTPRVNPRVQQPQESEEDVAKFRAWLDGLTRE
ncbi:MAG TPA: tetratricopeptide repeat protein [Gemmatimonadaceae bacterium]|nr:tetratricopeptide repeat protein [Gemmatimonadaceae bacterium]